MSKRKQKIGKQLEKQRLEKIARLQQNVSTPSTMNTQTNQQKGKQTAEQQKKQEEHYQQKKQEIKETKEQKDMKEKQEAKEQQQQKERQQIINRLKHVYDVLRNDFQIGIEIIKKGMIEATKENEDEITVDNVIEWICLHVPSNQLPPSLGGTFDKFTQSKQVEKQTEKQSEKQTKQTKPNQNQNQSKKQTNQQKQKGKKGTSYKCSKIVVTIE